MAITRRLVEFYWDVTDRVLRDSGGNQIKKNKFPYITFREEIIINLHLVTDGSNPPTAYTELASLVDSATTYQATIDDDYDHSSTTLCKALDAAINVAGEWNSSAGNADPDTGQFSIKISADTATFQTAAGTNKEIKNTELELQVKNGSGDLIWSDRIPFRCFNIQDDDGSTPPSVGIQRGVETIASGVSTHAVTGLGLSNPPTKVFCQIAKPATSGAGSLNIFATPVIATYTTDGFTVHLSGTTDTATYELNYEVE